MNKAATIALAPFGALYSAAVKVRSTGYEKQFLKSHTVAAPVISVGNITVGGTGKTPLVQWAARRLAESGRRVCILTRGYRRENTKQRVVVSDGEQILSDVIQSGDEAMMLAQALLGKASVVCDVDRVAGAQWAIENLNAEVLLLDDGFQHRRLARDLDIVTIDASNPFGNGRLLPAGILREPINNLSRADCIVLTRVAHGAEPKLIERIRQATNAPIMESRTVIERVCQLDGSEVGVDAFARQPVAAFCGIGNPRAFFKQLCSANFDVRHTTAFRDHQKYSQSDIDRISDHAKAKGAQALTTTAKDAVKLQELNFDLPCYVAEIELELSDTPGLLDLIGQAIAKKTK
ncbi:MAG TPA: tetraacyldisaccharide 4'-kinase [Pyrinomonadaceae bacterium]|nr:tetraacyldisaccharide 4'-kinase [Pyrinomonadaceae bacterium]